MKVLAGPTKLIIHFWLLIRSTNLAFTLWCYFVCPDSCYYFGNVVLLLFQVLYSVFDGEPMFVKDIIATGGIDTNAIVFDRPSGQIVSTLSGHSKKVFLTPAYLFRKSLVH